jgi:hypothetical protein
VAQALGQRRLGYADAAGGGAQAARLDRGDEIADLIQPHWR